MWNLPCSSRNHIFYIVIFLHLHWFTCHKISLHGFTLTLLGSVNKIHCGIYTYMKCKSQTIYTHNTDSPCRMKPLIRVVPTVHGTPIFKYNIGIVWCVWAWSHDLLFERGYDANMVLDWPTIMIVWWYYIVSFLVEVNLKGQNANLSIKVSHGMHLQFNASSDFAWFELVLVWFGRVDRSVNKHLRIQRRWNSHTLFICLWMSKKSL